ncbi:variant 3, Boron transporter 4 [Lathyrus oleraceus]|nr:variant 3, Boron transporter 4 [Pisum sativum]
MAQLKEFNLKKPSAYHYDIFLLGFTTLLGGLLGLTPSNGVLPQQPYAHQEPCSSQGSDDQYKMVESAKESI